MEFKWTTDVNSNVYSDALAIRFAVFVDEQHVPKEIEKDTLETACHHAVGYINDIPLATARLYITKDTTTAKVQRVAVSKHARGKQFGRFLMDEVERYACTLQITTLRLGAQNHAIGFYQQLGYTVDGLEYEDAGILHHDMEKKI